MQPILEGLGAGDKIKGVAEKVKTTDEMAGAIKGWVEMIIEAAKVAS
jgi:hypothetical protein